MTLLYEYSIINTLMFDLNFYNHIRERLIFSKMMRSHMRTMERFEKWLNGDTAVFPYFKVHFREGIVRIEDKKGMCDYLNEYSKYFNLSDSDWFVVSYTD